MAKTASLTSSLVAKKGQAVPAVTHAEAGAITIKPFVEASEPVKRVAMTVKLEPSQYEALKTFAAKRRMKGQEIFVEALDRYLRDAAQHG